MLPHNTSPKGQPEGTARRDPGAFWRGFKINKIQNKKKNKKRKFIIKKD
jgi:hypothetical protein